MRIGVHVKGRATRGHNVSFVRAVAQTFKRLLQQDPAVEVAMETCSLLASVTLA